MCRGGQLLDFDEFLQATEGFSDGKFKAYYADTASAFSMRLPLNWDTAADLNYHCNDLVHGINHRALYLNNGAIWCSRSADLGVNEIGYVQDYQCC
jgi:hypothetical protein